MEYLDRLILIAILGGVAGVLLFLLRRNMHHDDAAPPIEAPPKPVVVERPVAVKSEEPAMAADLPAQEIAAGTGVAYIDTKGRRRKAKKTLVPAVVVPCEKTPITAVVDMLKHKDTLAAAFVLHEVLAPPVSKRG